MEAGQPGKQRKVAIIPARGGSKRIPYKNIVLLKDKPLIAYTIEAALKSGIFEEVIVSTDDQKIADIAVSWGASVPFLRDELADDHATISEVIAYVLEQLESRLHKQFDTVFQLMPNCPLRTHQDIIAADKQFEASGATYQISAFPFGWMNPWWAFSQNEKKEPEMVFEQAYQKRSQDLPQLFCPSGAIWIANCQALKETRNFYSAGYTAFILNWKSAVDIDDYEDLEMAEVILNLRNGEN